MGYRISLRYKLALPVSIFVFLILVLLTHTTFRLVREFVTGAFEAQILAEVEIFAETIDSDFLNQDFKSVQARLDEFAKSPGVYGVRIVDPEGSVLFQSPASRNFPSFKERFVGTKPLFSRESLLGVILHLDSETPGNFAALSPKLFLASALLQLETKEVGRVEGFFTTQIVNEMIRKIYRKRILVSFLGALGIALLTSILTWAAIRPLFRLGGTVQQILRGNTEARAKIRSGDEIEDLAEAFNEMVGRLEQSLKNLRVRSEALEESEEKYRVLVENASDVIWLLSPKGEILFLSQGFVGISRESLLEEGLPLFLTFHTEDSLQKFEAAIEQVKKTKVPVSHLATVYHDPKTHNEVFYSSNLTPVLTRTGELKAIQAVSRDVTELKRIELMKERLIRDVAHELKTPVAKFQMTLNWLDKELEKQREKERYREVLDLMKRNADLLMEMIVEVMDLSRLESGTERLVRKSCDLNQILVRVLEDLEPFVREKKLVLEKKLNSGVLSLEGDEAMLYRLFTNLVVNAVKFTPQGKITVATSRNPSGLRAVVSDTGIGLEEEDLTRVFDRFFQKTPASPGMGIGLALAHEITLLHGGRIWAESEGPGKGSAFIVEFPQ